MWQKDHINSATLNYKKKENNCILSICNGKNCPVTFCTSNYQCTIAKADGLGNCPVNHLVLRLWARKHQLTLLTTGIARYVMSNASSQTSSRWCMQCDNTTYVITGIPFQWPHPINKHIWSAECFFPSKPLSQLY